MGKYFIENRAIYVLVGLILVTLVFPMAAEAVIERRGLPEIIAFNLEDGRHGTPGITLSFALPAVFDYECRRILFSKQLKDTEITITFLGVESTENYGTCRLVKVPAPIRERVVLPPETGNYRIIFVNGERRDAYTLTIMPDNVTLVAEGSPTFTTCDQIGEFMRVDPRWLWVDLSFLTEVSFKKMRVKRDEILSALIKSGARTLVPPPGRYLLDGFVRQFPGDLQDAKEEHFFVWDGDWQELRKLANRYKHYATIAHGRPVMILWLSSRDNVVSTSDGFLIP